MSDFGSIIIANKKDGSKFSKNEIQDISIKLEQLVELDKYSNALGENFNYDFQKEEGSNSAICVLSEYYYGEDEDIFEFVEDTELNEVKEIAKKLILEYPEINFEGKVEEW